ncbi:unnamed protein product [Caenorhabditis angaria]|uniref:T20D4.11-like domain-containing protein n=1 Tax=Caenorhabditis angaria TaxID=860376 RepID=A0A9P1MZJ0_9PELO|nr:unnamed protein product [Caenorhabditis angaria]
MKMKLLILCIPLVLSTTIYEYQDGKTAPIMCYYGANKVTKEQLEARSIVHMTTTVLDPEIVKMALQYIKECIHEMSKVNEKVRVDEDLLVKLISTKFEVYNVLKAKCEPKMEEIKKSETECYKTTLPGVAFCIELWGKDDCMKKFYAEKCGEDYVQKLWDEYVFFSRGDCKSLGYSH